MEKDNKMGILIIIGVVLAILLVYVLTNYGKNMTKKEEVDNSNVVSKPSTTNRLKNHLNDIKNPISYVILKEANTLKNQSGETISLKKNVNLLASEENKQLLAMEYILKDLSNNKNFVILKDNKEVVNENEKNPIDSSVLAYYPYNSYNIIYKKLFNKDFNPASKKVSTKNNNYDKSNYFVYYNNVRNNSNNLFIDSFSIEATSYDDTTSKYTASASMKYSQALAIKVGTPTDEVTVVYSLVNNEIIIESFMIK